MFWALVGNLSVSETAIKTYVHQVAVECPNVLSAAPRGEQFSEFWQELLDALEVTAMRPDKPAALAYIHAIRGLRWSNSSLTRRVSRDAQSDRSEAALSMPPLCQDLRAWEASGYHVLPATTRQFLRDSQARSNESPELISVSELKNPNRRLWRKLLRHEPFRLQQAARRTQHLEGRFATSIVATLLLASGELDALLGLKPTK